jgi:cobalt-zinc-cadmium efflux system outer membrane protein
MTLARGLQLAAVTALLGAGCAKYTPQPLSPETSAAAFGHRTLSDSALHVFLATYDSSSTDAWDMQRLALTAWYFRPELEVSRRTWRTTQAAEVTAGARPPIGVAGGVSAADNPGPFESRWTVTLGLIFRIELGGKRGARIAAAQARSLVAELQARVVAWDIASDVRTAALTVVQGDSSVATWTRRVDRSEQIASQVQRLYQSEAAGQSMVDEAVAEARLASRELTSADAQRIADRASLARLMGLPASALDTLTISTAGSIGCALTEQMSLEELRGVALRRRYEMGVALAEYAVAEADLRVQITRQYPDLELVPGYSWDQGLHRWIGALALPNLLRNRNQGPIGEAIARRNQMASGVEAMQQIVLGEVEGAYSACQASAPQLLASQQLVDALRLRERTGRAAYDRGETGQFESLGLALAVADAEGSLQDAQLRRVVTGSDLERATGAWSMETVSGLPDPLLLPTATFVVQETMR